MTNREKQVINHLKIKRDQRPGHENIRPLLLVLGGSMCGAYGAGAIMALHKLGLENIFTTVVGKSTGAATGAYFLTGLEQTRTSSTMYFEECSQPSFVRYWRWKRNMDLDWLVDQMRSGPKALNVQALNSHPSSLYFGVGDKNGQVHFIDAKHSRPDIFAALHAAMAIPGVYGQRVVVNGEEYLDSLFESLPLRQVLEQFKPTDVLIIPNVPARPGNVFRPSAADALFGLLALKSVSPRLAIKLATRMNRFTAALQDIEHSDLPVAVLWPPECGIKQLTRDPEKLRSAMWESELAALNYFV